MHLSYDHFLSYYDHFASSPIIRIRKTYKLQLLQQHYSG